MAADPIYPGSVISFGATVTSSTSLTTLVTGAANGTRVEHLRVFNGHTAAVTVSIYKTVGGTDILIAQMSVAAAAIWNVMQSLESYVDKQYILLASGDVLKYAAGSSVANPITASGDGGTY